MIVAVFFPRDPVFGTCPGHQNKDQRWLDIRHLVNNKTLKWKIFGDSDGVPKQFLSCARFPNFKKGLSCSPPSREQSAPMTPAHVAVRRHFWVELRPKSCNFEREREFKMGHACSGLGVKSDFTSGQAIPSLGSYGHPNICRRPCILLMRGACQKGADCGFCHLAHDA